MLNYYYKLLDWFPIEKVNWEFISENPAPEAIYILEQNLDKICWWRLSANPVAIYIKKIKYQLTLQFAL